MSVGAPSGAGLHRRMKYSTGHSPLCAKGVHHPFTAAEPLVGCIGKHDHVIEKMHAAAPSASRCSQRRVRRDQPVILHPVAKRGMARRIAEEKRNPNAACFLFAPY
jgi:hypothetical protein